MLGWIEKVVPQPRIVEKVATPELKAKESKSGCAEKKPSEAEGSSKKDGGVTPDPVSITESSGRGVLTWLSEGLEKVVPQPAVVQVGKTSDAATQKPSEATSSQSAEGAEKKEAVATLDPTSTTDSSGRGVLIWLSEGLEKVVPHPSQDAKTSDAANQKPSEATSSQPAEGSEKKEAVVTPDPASTTESSGRGVLTWLSEGLEKVVPQPSQPATVQDGKTSDAANQTEAQNVVDGTKQETTLPSGVEEELQPSSDNNAPEKTGGKKVFTRLLEEFGKMIPQPENVKKTEGGTPVRLTGDQGNTKEMPQKESSPVKPLVQRRDSTGSYSGLGTSLFPQTLGGDGGSGMFKRIIQGLEKVIPQPVSKEKPAEETVDSGPAAGVDSGQERSKGA